LEIQSKFRQKNWAAAAVASRRALRYQFGNGLRLCDGFFLLLLLVIGYFSLRLFLAVTVALMD
jgi:hypothetical protein